MEWVRVEQSPWGQTQLIGLSWDWLWVAVAAGALAIVAHAALRLRRGNRAAKEPSPGSRAGWGAIPERIIRHTLPSRLFHWTMALAVTILLATSFLPILGFKFPWVFAHWVTGLLLAGLVLFHVIHASFFKGLRTMWIGRDDLRTAWATLRSVLDRGKQGPAKGGKNSWENKLFHHAVAAATLAATGTGLLMMAKVDTPWWSRNPYVISDDAWGIVYVLHGAGAVALVTLIMLHLYFAARPDKWWITRSMFSGTISRERYLETYDPGKWPPSAAALPAKAPGAR